MKKFKKTLKGMDFRKFFQNKILKNKPEFWFYHEKNLEDVASWEIFKNKITKINQNSDSTRILILQKFVFWLYH